MSKNLRSCSLLRPSYNKRNLVQLTNYFSVEDAVEHAHWPLKYPSFQRNSADGRFSPMQDLSEKVELFSTAIPNAVLREIYGVTMGFQEDIVLQEPVARALQMNIVLVCFAASLSTDLIQQALWLMNRERGRVA
jgi:hypothetical protein